MSIAIRTALFALAAAAPCCPTGSTNCSDCECVGPATSFEITGDGNNMRVIDAAGAEHQSLDVDLTGCACAAQMTSVQVTVRHRQGFALQAPTASACIVSPSGGGTSAVSFTAKLGEGCTMPWLPRDSSPTIVFPIKVKP